MGDTQHDRISQLLAWVTNNTNVLRLRKRVRPEGVTQLALRRRLQPVRARGNQGDASQLREELDNASRLAAEQAELINFLEDSNTELEIGTLGGQGKVTRRAGKPKEPEFRNSGVKELA